MKNFKKALNMEQGNQKNLMKSTRGITLIALVITVIVMLILAGVAISVLTDDGGLFEKTRGAAEAYENSAEKEAKQIDDLMNSIDQYIAGIPVSTKPKTDGSWNGKVNTPNTSKLPSETTKYVTWSTDGQYREILSDKPLNDWYDYQNGRWANIKTTNEDSNLEAYWVWIPRFAYKLPESTTAKKIDIIFIEGNGRTGANGEICYYSTDTQITSDGSGLYSKKTSTALQEWIIHPAFTFGDEQLSGIWVAKFEASNKNGKVQIKAGETGWTAMNLATAFDACRNIQTDGGALGTNVPITTENIDINSHMMKNMEWGAVSILSQSEYGIFNPSSANNTGSVETTLVWYNTSAQTGCSTEKSTGGSNVYEYNTEYGVKASTTGTIYGVYDMARGSRAGEYVMGLMATSTTSGVPSLSSTGFSTLPDSKYYDLYKYGTTYYGTTITDRSLIGDAIGELVLSLSSKTWHDQYVCFLFYSSSWNYRSVFSRGSYSGIFAFGANNGSADDWGATSFRPTLIVN